MNALIRHLVLLGSVIVALAPSLAFTQDSFAASGPWQVEEAAAENLPWSGYWWPIRKGELIGPLLKYDRLTGDSAAPWELEHNPPGPGVPEWHGYCHGWTAAALLESEPRSGGRLSNADDIAELDVADQKAWLSVSHAADTAQTYGDRFGDGMGSEDQHDIAPDRLWQLLRTFIKQQRLAVAMDLDPSPEVWNYPVYAYRVEHAPHPNGGGLRVGRLSLWAAENAVPPNFVGLLPHFQTYTFEYRTRNGAIELGTGRWTGESIRTHPDFAWYPILVAGENPELNYAKIKQIVGEVSAGDTAPRPSIPGFDPADENSPLPVSPIQLVRAVSSRRSAFFLDLQTAPFGTNRFVEGERISLRLHTERGGYLYLLHVTPRGELSLLYPKPGEEFRVSPSHNQAIDIPANRQAGFRAKRPFGNHLIKAIVSQRPLLLTGLVREQPPVRGTPRGELSSSAVPGGFRICPTLERFTRTTLVNYLEAKVADTSLPQPSEQLITKFAQDEMTYYVGPSD